MKFKFPNYVKTKYSAIRLISSVDDKAVYFRDAGHWHMKVKYADGKIIADGNKFPMEHTNGTELVECTKIEWQKDNHGYCPDEKEHVNENN